ncbi:MAG: sulfite exporter TauE/SafE family protein [Thioalkalispiraceae bacterium]|jgi:hypothetical protein
MFEHFSLIEILLTGLLFMWAGFVRSGLGFGGAALGLPLMLFIYDQPVYWLPIIGAHLLFFSAMTLRTRLHNVDWLFLRRTLIYILPATFAGVFGLLNLPNQWLVIFVYSITLFYAITWIMNWVIQSNNTWVDRFLLFSGGYVAGTSLTGAPLMVAVFMRHVSGEQLRNTLFVLWFMLVTIKMSTFAALGVDLNLLSALVLIPVAAIGHFFGLKVHDRILTNDRSFKRIIGLILALISFLGLLDVIWPASWASIVNLL